MKCALINVPQLILITTLFSVLFHEIPNAKKGLRILIVSLLIAQLVFILLNQFRKREPYVFISSAGILLHIRSFENYGIGSFQSRTCLFRIVKLKIAIYPCLTQWKEIWALLIRICGWIHQIFLKVKLVFGIRRRYHTFFHL